jgi:MoaA/NifB/PqqE/SkfB family radical SAM enzyme
MGGLAYLLTGLNKIALFFGRVFRLSVPIGVPGTVTIETTSFCNLHCLLCPVGRNELKRKQSFMPFEKFKQIVDQLPKISKLTLTNFGEPLITPRFLDMVEYARNIGFSTITVSTNGNIEVTDKYAERIAASGITLLLVAFDGYDQESYTKYRAGGDFKKLCSFVKKVAAAKKRTGSGRFKLVLQQHLFRHNEEDIGKIRKIAMRLGADSFRTKKVVDFTKSNKDLFERMLPFKKKFVDASNARGFSSWFSRYACQSLWYYMYINSDGYVTTCCSDPNTEFKFGPMGKDLLHSWKHGMAKFRKAFAKDYASIGICKKCLP